MPAGEQPDQQPFHHVFLPDDNAVDLPQDALDKTALLAHFLVDFLYVCRQFHSFSPEILARSLLLFIRQTGTLGRYLTRTQQDTKA